MTKIQRRMLLTQSDQRLACMVQAGHEPAFEALVHRYRRPLLCYCRRLCSSEARAEEALQQALLNAWMALRRQTEVRDLRAWLYRVAHNAAVNSMRGEQLAQGSDAQLAEGVHAHACAPSAQPTCIEDAIALREAFAGIAALPDMQREVVLRTALAGESHEEVAAALGISDDAVRGLLYRARSALRAGCSALTPTPVLAWAARGAERGAGSGGQRIAELAAGGGSAGLAGIAAKGGVVALTAGAALTGVLAINRHRHALAAPRRDAAALRRETAQSAAVAGAARYRDAIGTDVTGVRASAAVVDPGLKAPASLHRRDHSDAHGRGSRPRQAAPAAAQTETAEGVPGQDRQADPGWISQNGRDGAGWSRPSSTESNSRPVPANEPGEHGWRSGTQGGAGGEAEAARAQPTATGGDSGWQQGDRGQPEGDRGSAADGGEEHSGRESDQAASPAHQAEPHEWHGRGNASEGRR